MKVGRLLNLAALCILSSGCCTGGIFYEANRNLICSPLHYSYRLYDWTAPCMYRIWAEGVWHDVRRCQPGNSYSYDYADGFKDGFVDYLDNGGKGEPPPMPPRKYWKKHYQTPQGHLAIQEWYAGFRHGTDVAQASGYRQYAIVPPPRVVDSVAAPAVESLPPAKEPDSLPEKPPAPDLPEARLTPNEIPELGALSTDEITPAIYVPVQSTIQIIPAVAPPIAVPPKQTPAPEAIPDQAARPAGRRLLRGTPVVPKNAPRASESPYPVPAAPIATTAVVSQDVAPVTGAVINLPQVNSQPLVQTSYVPAAGAYVPAENAIVVIPPVAMPRASECSNSEKCAPLPAVTNEAAAPEAASRKASPRSGRRLLRGTPLIPEQKKQ